MELTVDLYFPLPIVQLWHNIRIGHAEQPDLIQLVDILSQHFESLYEKEVRKTCLCLLIYLFVHFEKW